MADRIRQLMQEVFALQRSCVEAEQDYQVMVTSIEYFYIFHIRVRAAAQEVSRFR